MTTPRYRLAFYLDSVPFTKAVIAGTASLGGSESACIGLARALRARGHEVHLFVTQLERGAEGLDAAGVVWHPLEALSAMSQYCEWDLVCALRMAQFFAGDLVNARLRWLWNQDLLIGEDAKNLIMASSYQVDRIVYVSAYHRHQWEAQLPCLAPFGWVTKNGYDPTLVPRTVTKRPHRLIHISRPERGLSPLLAMWPEVRRRVPDAEVAICRYDSMYDAAGWGRVCADYDRRVAAVQAKVGGIVPLGQLGKPALYQAIAEAAAMWYPGIATFAETSCIAAIEAQACGTPFVGSARGALPETVPSGILIGGDAEQDQAYHDLSIEAVCQMMRGCERQATWYRDTQAEGRRWVQAYTFEVIAAEWEQAIALAFANRALHDAPGIVRRLLHDDDPVAAKTVLDPESVEGQYAQYIIDGKDQNAEDYGARAIQDPIAEGALCERFHVVAERYKDCTRVLDVACGNGAFALWLAKTYPTVTVHGLDYSAHNIEVARAAAASSGYADRCTFDLMTVYDFARHELTEEWLTFAQTHAGRYDGLFVGEFLEHVANAVGVIDGLEPALSPWASVVYTMPNGPLTELMERGVPIRRGHVHRFAHDDVETVFGDKAEYQADYLAGGFTARGRPVGHWLVSYRTEGGRTARPRPLAARVVSTRPYPRLSVGLICKNAANDIGRCLSSLWPIADEIILGDTGSTDQTKAIAEEYGATVIDLAPIEDQPEGFAGARNQVLAACTGEWFLWIDADEILLGVEHLAKYLDPGGPMQGYVIRQQHLYHDLPSSYDIPVRLFRRRPEIRFYGCIHEQPAMGDANTEIDPTLELRDVTIVHLGYLTEDTRKRKMFRNLPFLQKDTQVFPDRVLGKVLVLRDYVNMAEYDRETAGTWRAPAVGWLQRAVLLFDQYFADPGHKYHTLARPWYERAIRLLGALGLQSAVEMELAIGGRQGGLGKGHPSPERVWVRSAEEFERIMQYKVESLAKDLRGPAIDTMPYPAWPGADATVEAPRVYAEAVL